MSGDWPTATIGEIAKVARGGSRRPITKFITDEPDGVNWIKIGDTEKGGRYITGTAEKIIRDGIKRSRWVDEGDFLLTNSMSFGRPYILKTSGCIHDGWLVLKPDYKRINQDFLYYALSSPTTFAQFDAAAAGSTVRNLNIGLVEKVRIPLPPLEEQKRIVAVLDQAFAALDRARTLAEANLADAEELFDSWASDAFRLEGVDRSTVYLPDISENLDRLRVPITKADRKPGNVPYYGASGEVDRVADFIFDEDLLLVSEDGANLLARTYPIAFSISGKSWVNNHAHVLRFENPTDQEYVRLYLNSIPLDDFVSGMAQPKLNQKALNSIPIPFPPSEERARIVEKAAEISAASVAAMGIYDAQLTDVAELRQSLLQNAFAGELT